MSHSIEEHSPPPTAAHSRIRLLQLKSTSAHPPPTSSTTMSKLLVATLVLAALVLDPVNAHSAAVEDASPTSLRIADDGRMLLQESSASGSLSNPLYEARTNIKGCKWYQYFMPWSCCGTNTCD